MPYRHFICMSTKSNFFIVFFVIYIGYNQAITFLSDNDNSFSHVLSMIRHNFDNV